MFGFCFSLKENRNEANFSLGAFILLPEAALPHGRASLPRVTRDCDPSCALLHTPSLTLLASRVFLYARIPRLACWEELTQDHQIPRLSYPVSLGGIGKRIRFRLRFGPLYRFEALQLLHASLFSHGTDFMSHSGSHKTPGRRPSPFPDFIADPERIPALILSCPASSSVPRSRRVS